jgi:hypothetical protein
LRTRLGQKIPYSDLAYLAALIALMFYSAVDARLNGIHQVEMHYITADVARAQWSGWTLYLFILLAPVALTVITILVLPLLAFLNRSGRATIFSIVMMAPVWSLVWAIPTWVSPSNEWCTLYPCGLKIRRP